MMAILFGEGQDEEYDYIGYQYINCYIQHR